MNSPISLRTRLVAFLAVLVCPLLFARTPNGDGIPVTQPKAGEFVFTLLPKAFQRTPTLEMTVNTEMTPYGRLLRLPTPENPVYYVSQSSGFRPMGEAAGNEKPPSPEVVERTLKKSLAVNGYLPSTSPAQKPTLVILYFWGSHNRMDRELAKRFPELDRRQRLERAMLVGGHTQVDLIAETLEWGERLTDRTPRYEYLRDQSYDDLYFVVASAYDYLALANKERKLVWRTTMTVNARGVGMQETISPLIVTAGPYFGRDMKEPEIAERRIGRWGVSIGDTKVIESDVPLPEQTAPTTREPHAAPAPAPQSHPTPAPSPAKK